MFPLRDENPIHCTPYVTFGLIGANIIAFFIEFSRGPYMESFVLVWGLIPAELIGGDNLPASPGVPPMLTLLTSMFLHGGIGHIVGNLWFLWIFGDNIEHDLGRVRYLLFYLLCGIVASLAHVLPNMTGPSSMIPSLGASGAISGVMGAYLVLHSRRRVTVLLLRMVTQVPGFVAVGLWFLFQIISSLGMLGGTVGCPPEEVDTLEGRRRDPHFIEGGDRQASHYMTEIHFISNTRPR